MICFQYGSFNITVLCKRNESEVRQISSFVLAECSRIFAMKFRRNTREPLLNETKFRWDLFEISCLRKRKFAPVSSGKRNFADTVYNANMQTESNANTQACIALNRYTVGLLCSIASIAGIVHHSALCGKVHKITILVDNDLLRIL